MVQGQASVNKKPRLPSSRLAVEKKPAKPKPTPAPVVDIATPPRVRRLNNADRERLFGRFDFEASPTKGNPERIIVDRAWVNNAIVHVAVPQLIGVRGVPRNGNLAFHHKVGPRFLALVAAWEAEGVLGDILTWNGSYVPRFSRGRAEQRLLSAHSWGTAFDINVPWNGFRSTPAAPAAKGSVHALAAVAKRLGWVWGGDFSSPDGMHFEMGRFIEDALEEEEGFDPTEDDEETSISPESRSGLLDEPESTLGTDVGPEELASDADTANICAPVSDDVASHAIEEAVASDPREPFCR